MNFVCPCKKEVFVIITEINSNLFPQCLLLFIYFDLFVVGWIFFKPATIPMDINYCIHIVINTIVYNFFHTGKSCIRYFICSLIFDICIPRTWYTHGIKSGCFYSIYQSFRRLWVAPCCFSGSSSICRFERIA